jgi:serine/threonine protein kinase/WD40 repeat protein
MRESGIFKAAVKLPAQERAAYLDQACGADAALRREVEELLRAHDQAGEFMQRPALADATTTLEPGPERPGMRVGPYKLLQYLGEGGMGTVFLAEQTEPVRRLVALKIIKPGLDSSQILARFEAERQALALMDHPNIARVFDAGTISSVVSSQLSVVREDPTASALTTDNRQLTTNSGRPYFVMELVKGVPITTFCDQNRLTTRQRLELFIPVCQAIQHAHTKGIIHRDVKPSNVLVALYDGKPVPKVIDFGVAKAMAEPLTQRTLFTQIGQIVGTFEYMSPEQATLNQLDIDTRSDIYSLGVLLYELLTGLTPFDKEHLGRLAVDQILRTIREEEPPRPSARLSSQTGALALAATYRGSNANQLSGLLRGELDWIVMKCLEKERDRRFVTAGSLARDVERYLRDEPITACPPSLAYRARKAFRKHRAALSVAAILTVVLLAGVIASTWQAIRATYAEDAAARERDAALAAGRKAADEGEKTRAALTELRADQFAWDMQTLPLAWEAGHVTHARQLLERQLPQAGKRDLRGFEWYFWDRQTHAELQSTRLAPFPDALTSPRSTAILDDWSLSGDGSRVALFMGRLPGAARPREHPTLRVWDVASGKLLLTHELAPREKEAGARAAIVDSHVLSHDGKRILLAASVPTEAPADGEPGRTRPRTLPTFWIRVLDVDSGKVLLDARQERCAETLNPTGGRLSRDGRRLATEEPEKPGQISPAGRTRLWDLDAPGQQPVTIEGATISAFSPDGSRVLGRSFRAGPGGGDRGRRSAAGICVWDTATGAELMRLDLEAPPTYSPDGALLACTVAQRGPRAARTRTLKVFNATTGAEVASVPLTGVLVPEATETSLAYGALPPPVFSPDGSLLAVAHSLPRAGPSVWHHVAWYLVEPRTGRIRHTLEDPSALTRGGGVLRHPVRCFSGDGKQFLCEVDNVIRTFEVATGRPLLALRGHVLAIAAAMPTADGRRLHSVEVDGTLKVWDLRPNQPARIAAVDEPLRDPEGNEAIPRRSYTISADGARAARVGAPGGDGADTVHVWDSAGNGTTVLKARPHPAAPATITLYALHLSADGKRVALSRNHLPRRLGAAKAEPANPVPPQELTVWDVASRRELFHRELGPGGDLRLASLVALAPDGATVAIAGKTREAGNRIVTTLKVLDVDTGREVGTRAVPGNWFAPRFSPDGTRLAGVVQSPAADGTITEQVAVWDVSRGGLVTSVAADDGGGSRPVSSLTWSPDGTRLAQRGPGAEVYLLDAATGKVVRTLHASNRGGTLDPAAGIAFSPDGRRLACEVGMLFGTSVVNVLDTESGKELLSLPVPKAVGNLVGTALAFTPDGHRLLRFETTTAHYGVARGPRATPPRTSLLVTTWNATPREEKEQP